MGIAGFWRWWVCVVLVLMAATSGTAQPRKNGSELIAILDLRGISASEAESFALTERLREVILKSGQFTLVDRSQLESVLNEQALQQTGCTTEECAVQVGRILGIRKIVAGKITKLSDQLWQLSVLMVDVETAETLRAETVIHEGKFVDLLRGGVAEMGQRLVGPATTSAAAVTTAPSGQTAGVSVEVPEGAEVLVDGESRGYGPRRIENLVPGTHEVEVRLGGTRPWKQTVLVNTGQIIELKPKLQALRLAVFPVRRSGKWRQSEDETRGWVTKAIVRAGILSGMDVSHSTHVRTTKYTSVWGTDLSPRTDLADDTWRFLGGIDEAFVLSQGRQLGVDAVIAFSIDASGADSGIWRAFLVDTQSGAVREEKGRWPYGSGSSSRIGSDVGTLLRTYLESR